MMLTIPIEVTNQHHHQVAAERKQQQNAAAAAAANEDLSDTNDGPITAVSRRGNASAAPHLLAGPRQAAVAVPP